MMQPPSAERKSAATANGLDTENSERVDCMKVLIACEESQTVCQAFRERGHEAYSCDIQEPSGGHPEWHILGDALKAIEGGASRDDGR